MSTMDTAETAFEAEVELETEAARKEEERRRHRSKSQTSMQSEEDNEQSPLLARRDANDRKPSWWDMEEMAALPWYRRPSVFWVLGPFFLMACAFGGTITPKINLILELVCQKYISERTIADPTFTMIPVDFNSGNNDQCRIPEVQSRVSMFTLSGTLLAGLLSAITSPKLGAMSDRYGRKKILMLTSIGTICAEIITIFAATFPETFPVDLLLLGFALDGLTGSFIVAMAVSNAYATDCTPPASRNVVFGYFHSCLFTGIAVGPIIAGYIVRATGSIAVIFYILLGVHIFFVTFIGLVVPESLSKPRQMAARDRHRKKMSTETPRYVNFNLLEPLKVLRPTGPGTSRALRRNLFFLAAVDTIVFGVAMGSMTIILIYTNYKFGWKVFETSRFMTAVNSCRAFCLLVVLPALTRIIRGRPDPAIRHKNTGSDRFDVNVIRVAVFFDMLGYIGYTLSAQGSLFMLSGIVAAVGGIGSPSLQSSLTKHVPAEQTGQVLGASGLLHALARVVAPTVFNGIYSITVKRFPQTVFVCLSATFGLAFILTWFIKTHVYWDEERAALESEDAEPEPAAPLASAPRPIVDRVFTWVGSFGVFLGRVSGA